MKLRAVQLLMLGVALSLMATAPTRALELGDNQYPNSIMAPEPGAATHHRDDARWRRGPPRAPFKPIAGRETRRKLAIRGSSGSVLPTPLPKTQLIPPEGRSMATPQIGSQQQGSTIVPSAPSLGAIPNLPHGSETFQDRASRCSFQAGLNGVPGTATSQYMGACLH
jgi:hypothetical protein